MILLICLNFQEPLEGYEKFLMVGILLGTVIIICISIMSKRYYQTIGTLYMFLGFIFFFAFLLNEKVRSMFFSVKNYSLWWGNFLFFALPLFTVVGSLVLVVCGLVLVVRGGVWVARVSGVLFCFLSISWFGLQPSLVFLAF